MIGERRATLLLLFVLCSTIVCFPDFYIVEANPFTHIPLPEPAITIKSDGGVDPQTAPIHCDGNIYTFTEDIVGYTIIVEKDDVILDGGGYILKGYGSEGNFTFKGYADPTGILIMQQNGVTVRNMKISGFSYGIKITNLFTLACRNNILENNLLTENYYGVYMSGSWFTVLRNNRMNNNICNFYIYDFVKMLPPASDMFLNDVDSSNTVDGKPIIYWVNEQGKTVPSDAGYVALVKCTNMTVQNLNLSDNGQGILLMSTTNSLIAQNHVSHTDWGIFTYNSSNLLITKNNLENNDVGIQLMQGSNENMISENLIVDNSNGIGIEYGVNISIVGNRITDNDGWGRGLLLSYSHNNVIYDNSFLHNHEEGGLQVRILTEEGMQSGNMWDNGTTGNYWSDYNGTDSDDDHIGDTPYIIDENNQDNYPLMEPLNIPEFPSWTSMLFILTVFLIALAIYKSRFTKKREE
jgi:parallel beta-helix repeat protein